MVEAHVVATCEAIHAGIERLREVQRRLDLDGCNSLGSTAWASARRRAGLPDVERSRSVHDFGLTAAHPARLEVFRPRVERCPEYDMSMAYNGACARIDFPLGNARRIWGREAGDAFESGKQGAYDCDVNSPPAFLPVLPFRSRSGRPTYPTGRLRGTWTRDELAYAVERGYRIERMYSAQVYDRSRPLLRDWADSLWSARVRYERRRDPMERYIKALAVALPGTFGSGTYGEQLLWSPDPATMGRCPCLGVGRDGDCPCRGLCCDGCKGKCGNPIPVSRDSDLWVRLYYRLLDRAHIIWHDLVLGWVRVQVHRFATQDGRDGSDLVTIHTDGLRCLEPRRVPKRRGHGVFRLQGVRVEAFPGVGVYSPRGNTSVARDEASGALVVRSSGLPRADHSGRVLRSDEQVAQRILGPSAFDLRRGAEVTGWLPVAMRDGLRPGTHADAERPRLGIVRDRDGRPWIGQRVLDEATGITRAPTIDELEAMDARGVRR
jgi:hypothetical protein